MQLSSILIVDDMQASLARLERLLREVVPGPQAHVRAAADLAGARDLLLAYVGDVVPQAGAVEGAVEIIRGLDRHRLRRDAAAVAERVRRDYDWRTCVESLVPAISAVASASRRG